MYLYHGTDNKSAQSIKKNGINIHKCRKRLDFGIGFYTTQNLTYAKEWARKKQNSLRYGPCVLKFEFDHKTHNNLITRFSNEREWAEFIIINRKRIFYHSNIITKGMIADGKDLFYNVNQLYEKLNAGEVITSQEINSLIYDRKAEQIVFHDKKALDILTCCDIINTQEEANEKDK